MGVTSREMGCFCPRFLVPGYSRWSNTIPQRVTPMTFDQILMAAAFTKWYGSPKVVRVTVRVRLQKSQCLRALVHWYGYLPRYATPPQAYVFSGPGIPPPPSQRAVASATAYSRGSREEPAFCPFTIPAHRLSL